MVKFPEADTRLFHRVFVCRRCKSKQRANVLKILAGKISCRKCGYDTLRVKKRK